MIRIKAGQEKNFFGQMAFAPRPRIKVLTKEEKAKKIAEELKKKAEAAGKKDEFKVGEKVKEEDDW